MRIFLLLIMLLSSCSRLDNSGIAIREIKISELPVNSQCGCYYYNTKNETDRKKLIAVGDARVDGIYLNINGENIFIDNWRADYQENIHKINYSNDDYKISILSNVQKESRFSSDFNSEIIVKNESNQATINAYGQCGC